MQIIKILNNNSVAVSNGSKECVAMGKGIAFNKKVGQHIDPKSIDKKYNLSTNELTEKLAISWSQLI